MSRRPEFEATAGTAEAPTGRTPAAPASISTDQKPKTATRPTPMGACLTRKKANLARIGDTIKLHWENGLIVPDRVDTRRSFPRSADDVFLALVDAVTEEGQRASPKPKAGNYAPALFMKRRPQRAR